MLNKWNLTTKSAEDREWARRVLIKLRVLFHFSMIKVKHGPKHFWEDRARRVRTCPPSPSLMSLVVPAPTSACCRASPPWKNQLCGGGKGESIYFKQLHSFHFQYIPENYNAVRKKKKKLHVKPFFSVLIEGMLLSAVSKPSWLWFLSFKKISWIFWNQKLISSMREEERHTNTSFICKMHIQKWNAQSCFSYAEFCKKAGFTNEKLLLKVKSIG